MIADSMLIRSIVASSLLLFSSLASAQDHNGLDVEQLEHLFEDQQLNLPRKIANEKEARELEYQPASLKASTKSCILSRFAYYEPTDVILVVVYDQVSSGEFVRQHAFTRYTKYNQASASLRQVFSESSPERGTGEQFILVENEEGTGSGYRRMKWELIGWDGHELKTAFTATSSCYAHPGNGYDLDISGRLSTTPIGPSFLSLAYDFVTNPPEQEGTGGKDSIAGHWDEEYVWNGDAFKFESARPPAKVIRDFAWGLCDAAG
ncbi:MAG TPA: hypothetical protein VGX68_23860 [Thermoanaerobaculia bacterium]|nr:hypothetical protein [Thermoanaerobaculia bacterium]